MNIKNFPKNTAIGSFFLFSFGSYLTVKSEPIIYTDSPRYFWDYGNHQSFWNDLIIHSGRNLQTLLFSAARKVLHDSGTAVLFANLAIWFLVGTWLLYFIEKNVTTEKVKPKIMVLLVLVLTSHIIASWIIAALSESIALSLFIALLTICTLVILEEVEIDKAKNYLVALEILLYFSQPIWGTLALPLVLFSIFNIKKYLKQVLAIFLIAGLSMTIATFSHRLPYENTGLTFKGFESLTRAYFFSLQGRFGDDALGNTIKNCPPAYQLLLDSETQGTPMPLFYGFKEATKNCPEVVKDFNEGKSNSISKMYFSDFKNSATMTVVAFYAIANQQVYAADSLSKRTLGFLTMDLLIPFGLFLVPVCLFYTRSKKQILIFTGNNFIFAASGLLLYFQVGIEGERHTLPVAVGISLISWIIIAVHIGRTSSIK